MNRQHNRQLVKGALFLTIAGFISKILSAAYRIPLQNLMGDHGFYIYQQVYPFLGMIIILSLYGFPSAIAKVIADAERKGNKVSSRTVYGPVFIILFTGIGIFSLVFFLNAKTIAIALGDQRLTTSYQWIAVALLLIPFTSLLRGISQGFQRMDAIAYSQVGEQLIRVTIIIMAAILIFNGYFDVYDIGLFGVFASIGGALIAMIILLVFTKGGSMKIAGIPVIPWTDYMKTLLLFGLLASLNHMILILVQFADVFTLVPQLIKWGLAPMRAMELKGIFDRGMPLVQLGTVVGSSFALALVPTVARGNLSKSIPVIESALKISFVISVGAVIGLVLIFEETNVLLYQDASGTSSLQVLSATILLSSLSITALSILQSLGFFRRTGIFIMCTFIIKWLGNVLLVRSFGIMGSALATVGSLLFLVVISFVELKRQIPGINLISSVRLRSLIVSSGSMGLLLIIVKVLFPYVALASRGGLFIYVMALVSVGACLYMFLLVRLGAFSREEISTFPFATVLLRIHKGRD